MRDDVHALRQKLAANGWRFCHTRSARKHRRKGHLVRYLGEGVYAWRSTGMDHSLARANGWGSAGECPASACAKTPAARERVSRVAAGSILAGAADFPTRVSAFRPGEAVT